MCDNQILAELIALLPGVDDRLDLESAPLSPKPRVGADVLLEDAEERVRHIGESIVLTIRENRSSAARTVETFRDWMTGGTVVRVLGAGRARLAAAIPANRLAHGGARVFVQDDIVPMPHSIKGGGILAASASGKTRTVLDDLHTAKGKGSALTIVGIAAHDAHDFAECCDIFIGIHEPKAVNLPLQALADVGEYVISETLDALVVAAGRLAGFDETTWRLGHEDLGPTGPYDMRSR